MAREVHAVDSFSFPSNYQEYALNMMATAFGLLAERDLFDVVVFTGRSGVGTGRYLQAAGVVVLELPPFRIHEGKNPENRDGIPTPINELREKIAGKRVVFVDDQIGGGTTLHYVRLAVAELGGTFAGARMYRTKQEGDAVPWLLPSERDFETGRNGTGTAGVHTRFPDLASVFTIAQRGNPF